MSRSIPQPLRSCRAQAMLGGLRRAVLGTGCLLLLSGCAFNGPQTIERARASYGEVLVRTWNEQLLLNLVRLRYRDTPFFLEVTSVNASYTFQGELDASITVQRGAGDIFYLGPEVLWEESPTITYTPLAGEDFARALLAPIPLETLFLLPQNGWSAERVLRCCVQSVNGVLNAPGAAGPTPDYLPIFRDFQRIAELIRKLQVARLVELELKRDGRRDSAASVPPSTGKQGKKADAQESAEEDAEVVLVMRILDPSRVQARHPKDREILDRRARGSEEWRRELAELLDQEPDRDEAGRVWEYHFGIPGLEKATDTGFVEIVPRSLMGVLTYLSHGVQVPERDLPRGADGEGSGRSMTAGEGGRVHGIRAEEMDLASGQGFQWDELTRGLLTVKVQDERPGPEAFVAVPYRGAWFFIDDRDLTSKSTFSLLAQLFSLQAGSQQGLAPILTLGTGG